MTTTPIRDLLRRETRGRHERVDDAFERLLARPNGARLFLVAQAGAVLPLERALDDHPENVLTLLHDWPERRRSPLLAPLAQAAPRLEPPALGGRAAMLGALYVIEGSSLGARVLLRRLSQAENPVDPDLAAFLGHSHDPAGWRTFAAALERLGRNVAPEALLAGATAAFALFRLSAITVLGGACGDDGPPPGSMGHDGFN